jgi:hypothetical protein
MYRRVGLGRDLRDARQNIDSAGGQAAKSNEAQWITQHG